MMKFTDKSPHPFSLAHFYSVAEALDKRVADLMVGDGRFIRCVQISADWLLTTRKPMVFRKKVT